MNIVGKNLLTRTLIGTLCLGSLLACQRPFNGAKTSNQTAMRILSTDERSQDFDQMAAMFKSYYGPYQFKETTLGIKIDDKIAALKAQAMNAKTDEEFTGYIMQFGALLKDGHVQIKVANTSSGISTYKIPLLLTPVAGKALIGDITDTLKKATNFSIGDEVLEIDGQAPFSYLPTILKYQALARDISNQHLIAYALTRPSYMTELLPKSPIVTVKVLTANGVTLTQQIPWQTTRYDADSPSIVHASSGRLNMTTTLGDQLNSITNNIKQMGQVEPFFLNPLTRSVFKLIDVYPSDTTRAAFGLTDTQKPPIYAALYRHGTKTILLVRQGSYDQSDFPPDVYLKAYQALLYEFQDLADVLVLDQTHNPGGSYCASFYDIFGTDNDVQSVELLHADRKWINALETDSIAKNPAAAGTWDNKTSIAWGVIVEQAYDANLPLSPALPIFTGSVNTQRQTMRWTKPMLVLIDELAGSCGDMFPMLVKANKRAKLFGENTMGLGGNVEDVGTLDNSRIQISLTRGMYFPYLNGRAPQVNDFIENHGVAPDYLYDHTVDDFRGGFINYVNTFSDAAVAQIQ